MRTSVTSAWGCCRHTAVAESASASSGRRIDAARAAAFERIELTVYGRNIRAAALYRKVGFVLEGTRIRGKKLDGDYDDVHMMGLLL